MRGGGCVRRGCRRLISNEVGGTYTTDLVVLGGHGRGLCKGSEQNGEDRLERHGDY